MLDRKRNLWIGLVSAIASALLVYGVYMLQLKQIEWQETVRVVAAKDFIPSGVLVDAGMLEYRPMLKGALKPDMVLDIGEVVGTEPYMPLGKDEPILRWKIDKLRLMPDRNQSTFQIPKEYILSLSSGIRAGDRVRIYASSGEGESRRLLDNEITVASVKSANNVEVDNPRSANWTSALQGDRDKMYASRREANGAIEQINLNLTEGEWLLIDQTCKAKKSRLVIALTPLEAPGG